MFQTVEIADLDAPEVAIYSKLTEATVRRENAFIAESVPAIEAALNAGHSPISMLMERKYVEGKAHDTAIRCDVPVYTATNSTLAQLTGYHLTRGVLCAFKRKTLAKPSEILPGTSRICILEDIVDSTNIGALFRSAAALGMDAVLLSPRCCDPLCRRSIRVSMGAVFKVPWAYLDNDFPGTVSALHENGFKLIAMALTLKTISIDDEQLSKLDKLAVFLGNEGSGLSQETINACDYAVKIPMAHGVDSLNVATAGAVAFWELRRKP